MRGVGRQTRSSGTSAVPRSRRLLRVLVLTVATTAMSLLGGSPSWTEPIQPLTDRTPPASVDVADPSDR